MRLHETVHETQEKDSKHTRKNPKNIILTRVITPLYSTTARPRASLRLACPQAQIITPNTHAKRGKLF